MYKAGDYIRIINDRSTNFNGRLAVIIRPIITLQGEYLVKMLTGSQTNDLLFFSITEFALLSRG